MKKYFVISDIHNCHEDMINALNNAGFDENNESHILITLGDMFDRTPNGGGAIAIYEYLTNLQKQNRAIVLRGNHDTMFLQYLNGKDTSSFNYRLNGTRETFADFLHQTMPFETWALLYEKIDDVKESDFARWLKGAIKQINKEYPNLLNWLENMPWYYETKNHIFTHASIDANVENWHNPKISGRFKEYIDNSWDSLTWDDGSFYKSDTSHIDKTIVVGHFHTRHLREKYDIKDNQDIDSILKKDNKVFIDTCTNYTHKVNVYVCEDEEI